jgi:hypothetical protein
MNNYLRYILRGGQIGGIFGLSSSVLYLMVLGVMIKYSMLEPRDNHTNVIYLLVFILTFVIPAAAIGAVIGGLTGAVFGFLFKTFPKNKIMYFMLCELFCILFALLINAFLWKPSVFFPLKTNDNYAQEIHSMVFWEALVMTVIPSVIYIFVGLFSNLYLVNEFEILNLEIEILEEGAFSAIN